MTIINIVEEDDMISVEIGAHSYYYEDFRFHKDDIDTVIKYLKHRLKTSRAKWINCYQFSFWRNKIWYELLYPNSYRGSSVSRETLSDLIDELQNYSRPLTIDEIRTSLAKRKLSDIIRYAKRVGAA